MCYVNKYISIYTTTANIGGQAVFVGSRLKLGESYYICVMVNIENGLKLYVIDSSQTCLSVISGKA